LIISNIFILIIIIVIIVIIERIIEVTPPNVS